ncbi:MAG: hypothetical protein O3B31_11820 [Chloroflexi bacterium]|nr:hypothetical protein [Chloroflexota bacterium]MDA1004011.1 hypothetical protein [Chloroflexota bacterium]
MLGAQRRIRGLAPRAFAALALALLVTVGVFAADGRVTSSQALDRGDENSWLRIQNVGNSPANIDIDYYDLAGNRLTTERCPQQDVCSALRPGFGWSFFQQLNEALPAGYRGSGHVTVDQPFVAMMARDVLRSDGSFEIDGDSLRLGSSTPVQYAPLVVNNDEFVSRLTVENTSSLNPACVEIRYFVEGGLAPVTIDPPGATAGCAQGGHLLQPRATLVRDERSLPVPLGFDGAALVRSRPTDSGVTAEAQSPSLMVDTRYRNRAGIGSYRGINSDEVNRMIVLPMVDRNATQGQSTWTTRFRIMNGDPTLPNEVTLRFEGSDGSGNLIEIEHTVTVRGSLTCDQRFNGAVGCLPSDKPLPATFFGTVRMQAVQPIAAVAERLSASGGALSDYRGFSAAEASRQVVLPVLDKNYGPFGSRKGWNSWFRVLTFDGSSANVHIVYYSQAFPTGLIGDAKVVPGQATFRQWDDRRLPDGWVGSAVVVSDRPVVVIANLESDVFPGDPVMLYSGISLE